MIQFNIYNYVYQYISPKRRKPKIIQVLDALVNPLSFLWSNFDLWRNAKVYEVNLTPQTLALQEHLNNKFDSILRRILISHYDDGGLYVPLSTEGYSGIDFSLISEAYTQYLSIMGEIQITTGVSFTVYSPISINQSLISSELEKYKLAGKSYLIEQV